VASKTARKGREVTPLEKHRIGDLLFSQGEGGEKRHRPSERVWKSEEEEGRGFLPPPGDSTQRTTNHYFNLLKRNKKTEEIGHEGGP